ncbi:MULTISPECIES: glycosyltransferase family 4 protein [unclassified Granulicatella]|uniref:glycosyltransferase family 4 protein n=1 Tax=unclassified Granulicatella TaxID=2630493 RepID=UPI0010738369|nr:MULTISPECIES: glycosyltransferase family 4 protein [unclassified Granulicatella]MBF0781107.1 glycosyltransferase family 4 protein [Granulicatella sp. 19428wC4_WM01]TFU92027.1 glycosyltransferase family 4 protein [Granulicatella sp. WM01]
MKIAMFTDTYFPQVSGVATSIKVLSDELRRQGHDVTIFTTTDPHADVMEDEDIVRISSIPFMFFTDRRVVIGGMNKAYRIAKQKQFDIVHTHTEFGMGLIGKYVAYRLKIPIIHTYHTMYEKYLHYIANGKIIRPSHVKAISHYFCNHTSGVIAPGKQMADILFNYNITTEIRVIPTGVPIPEKDEHIRLQKRLEWHLEDNLVLLSLSRLAKEKSLDKLILALPEVLLAYPDAKLVFVGAGPARKELEDLVNNMALQEHVLFIGEIPNDLVYQYYQMADVYVNASETETQGLTYLEALVNGLPVIAKKNDYLSAIIKDKSLGDLFENSSLLAKTIIDYIPILKERQKLSQEEFNTLLYSVSSEEFSDNVLAFYHDVINQNKTNLTNPKKSILNKLYFSNWDRLK